MDTNVFGVAILAAGKGTRLKSKRPKVLHEICGQSLLSHVIMAAKSVAPAEQIYCIIGHEADKVRAAVESSGVRFILQTEQRGTGHAMQIVKEEFGRLAAAGETLPEHLMVLSGDVPLIRPTTLEALASFHLSEDAAMTILTAEPQEPFGYGRVIRKGGQGSEYDREGREAPASTDLVEAIVEQKDLQPEQRGVREINSGIYCFRTSALFNYLDRLSTNNANGEYYLTDVAGLMVAEGLRVVALKAESVDEVLGANTIAEMMHLDAAMRRQVAGRLMAQGVTIFRPDTCVIDAEVEIGADTVIEPFVQILGSTKIGPDCRVRSYSVLRDSVIGAGTLIRNGVIMEEAVIGEAALIGPYTHIRPGSEIGDSAHLGNFVETKKVRMGKGSKANHLSYLGDAIIGAGVNVGAGAITCNYDGVHKHMTTIGDAVFVGSDSTLVAPITVGDGAYIAAGSCITDDVPAGALALGRSRQVTKEGWAAAKKAERDAGKSDLDPAADAVKGKI
jgi:bifunctional UDP-N-acetylglucosamine pyrophosphorylase/glucosamine-1-phosphate N-acetyltransferase